MMNDYSCKWTGRGYCFLREFVSNASESSLVNAALVSDNERISRNCLTDVSDDCDEFCPVKYMASGLTNERSIYQMRCIIDARFLWGVNEHREISMNEALFRWRDSGLIAAFAKAYVSNNGVRKKHMDLLKASEDLN
jgi:hypothetical protein